MELLLTYMWATDTTDGSTTNEGLCHSEGPPEYRNVVSAPLDHRQPHEVELRHVGEPASRVRPIQLHLLASDVSSFSCRLDRTLPNCRPLARHAASASLQP